MFFIDRLKSALGLWLAGPRWWQLEAEVPAEVSEEWVPLETRAATSLPGTTGLRLS